MLAHIFNLIFYKETFLGPTLCYFCKFLNSTELVQTLTPTHRMEKAFPQVD